MSKYSEKCGPDAIDSFDDYERKNYASKGVVYERAHKVTGHGAITSCNVRNTYRDIDLYAVLDGITELGDGCFSKSSVTSVMLPSSLTVIGDGCFKRSGITYICLPDSLEKLGHNNFPATLKELDIPKNIMEFFVDNVTECRDMENIRVNEGNMHYKAKDGVLYNYDMTEVLFCPNAKTGKVVIPNTVTKIGDYCFANCQKLEMIVIPTSVREIGNYAFQATQIKKLHIPNSVKSIGVGCFCNANITEDFKFSSQVRSIPKGGFDSFNCKPALNIFSRLEGIEAEAFKNSRKKVLPTRISFYRAKAIKGDAFKSAKDASYIELFSSLNTLDAYAFDECSDDLVVRCFFYAPMATANEYAFGTLGPNATLVVPNGTKIIFENIVPWKLFPHIEEWATDEDRNDEGEFVKVSDEVFYRRLQSIADSKDKADRLVLKDTIEDLAQTYLYVGSDEEYKEAMSLIAYNRSYAPAIVPDLERRLCKEWANKYQLRIIEHSLLDSYASPMLLTKRYAVQTLPKTEETALPLPQHLDISPVKGHDPSQTVVALFNEEILTQLLSRLADAKVCMKIAVSWFTNYSLFKQIKQKAEEGVRIEMIINNDLINNGGYCLNLNELARMENVELSLVEYPHLLHHKFVIIDDELLITGSYNWTRFSAKNYENMVVLSDESTVEKFRREFNELVEKAEYKRVDKMPEYVKERPEYDRSAFKQYITEELNAQARESTDERDKITALKKATELNPEYLEKINPGTQEKYSKEFKVVDTKVGMQSLLLHTIQQASAKPSSEVAVGKVLTRQQEAEIDMVKASELIFCVDVSGSMSATFDQGHAHEIAKRALAAALALTDKGEVNIWTFGNDARFVATCGIGQIDQIQQIACRNEGTQLQKFVAKADSSISDGALCIIFTDDDPISLSSAIAGMKLRQHVFWQIIAYEQNIKNMVSATEGIENVSIISLSDYKSKTDNEISEMLLKDYVAWKKLKQ